MDASYIPTTSSTIDEIIQEQIKSSKKGIFRTTILQMICCLIGILIQFWFLRWYNVIGGVLGVLLSLLALKVINMKDKVELLKIYIFGQILGCVFLIIGTLFALDAIRIYDKLCEQDKKAGRQCLPSFVYSMSTMVSPVLLVLMMLGAIYGKRYYDVMHYKNEEQSLIDQDEDLRYQPPKSIDNDVNNGNNNIIDTGNDDVDNNDNVINNDDNNDV